MSTEPVLYTILADDEGKRLDVVVIRALEGKVGRSKASSLFDSGSVLVQGRVASKGWRARPGDVLTIALGPLDPSALPEPDAHLDIRLEREDLVVVHKSAGQPTAPIRPGEVGTLTNALVGTYPEMASIGYSPKEPGILHRLDTHTSGLVLAARTRSTFDSLSKALQDESLHKEYLLICPSSGLADSGVIDIPIGMEGKQSRRVVACIHAEQLRRCHPRPARTSYRVIRRHGPWALVIATAPKARRHQVRAHFAAIGHPLAGDALYGGDIRILQRQALHAHRIEYHGQAEILAFDVQSDLPEDMEKFLENTIG